ncbi:MAG: hypothetical protein GY928_16505 [Colwellia sp.]|nr:hypothetical protein [Colwellia sp.]
MIEELLWLLHASAKNLAPEQGASNLLVILYVISYILTKRSFFIAAFLCAEFVGGSSLLVGLLDYQYYLFWSLYSVLCYWIVFYRFRSLKLLAGYAMLVAIEITMTYNEFTGPEIETFLYKNYELFVVVVHIYIISAITFTRKLVRDTTDIVNSIRCVFCSSYNYSFIWYNLRNFH